MLSRGLWSEVDAGARDNGQRGGRVRDNGEHGGRRGVESSLGDCLSSL